MSKDFATVSIEDAHYIQILNKLDEEGIEIKIRTDPKIPETRFFILGPKQAVFGLGRDKDRLVAARTAVEQYIARIMPR